MVGVSARFDPDYICLLYSVLLPHFGHLLTNTHNMGMFTHSIHYISFLWFGSAINNLDITRVLMVTREEEKQKQKDSNLIPEWTWTCRDKKKTNK